MIYVIRALIKKNELQDGPDRKCKLEKPSVRNTENAYVNEVLIKL